MGALKISKIGFGPAALSLLIATLLTGIISKNAAALAPTATLTLTSILLAIGASSRNTPRSNRLDKVIVCTAALLLGIGAIGLAHGNSLEFFYLSASVITLLSGYLFKFKQSRNRAFKYGIPVAALITSIYYTATSNLIDDPFITSNYAGAVLLVIAPLWYAGVKRKPSLLGFWTLFIAIILPTVTRSVLAGILIGLIAAHFSLRSTAKFCISVVCLIIIAMLYIAFSEQIQNFYTILDVVSLTGKNLDTGRGDMWTAIIHSMSASDFILGGTDLSKIPELATEGGKQLSAHNGYISILAKDGILALSLALCLPIVIIYTTYDQNSEKALLLTTFTIAFFLREIFEVTLHENNFPIAGSFWFGVGLLCRQITEDRSATHSRQ